MAQLLKVDEWQSAAGYWYVADVRTRTGWRTLAELLDTDLEGFKQLLTTKYKATIKGFYEYSDKDSLLIFCFHDYKKGHQFKLDVNRIARKKNFLVENTI